MTSWEAAAVKPENLTEQNKVEGQKIKIKKKMESHTAEQFSTQPLTQAPSSNLGKAPIHCINH